MSDDESCPLCLEALDATDKKFRPCPCGYQMCLYCFNRVNSTSGRCPACRSPYSITERDMTRPAAEVQKAFDEEQSRLRELKEKEREQRERKRKQEATVQPSANGFYTSHPGAEILQTVRVRQRNLVYVTGLSPTVAKEEVLKKKEYFGRFGRILKVSINRKPLPSGRASSMSAYITFKREQDAMIAIKEMNQAVLDGRMIKASYGTTKYCSSFLQHTQCTNPGCLYLHDLAKEADCYTKDDLNGDRFIEEPFVDMQKRGLLTPDQSPTASQPSEVGPPPLMHLGSAPPGPATLPPARPQGNASAAGSGGGGGGSGMPTIPHIQISSGGSMSNAGVGSLGVGVTTPMSAIVAGTAGTGGGATPVASVGNGVGALPGSSPVVRTMAATLQQQHMPVVALNSQQAFPALGTDPRQHSQLTNGVSRRGSNSTNAHNHSSSLDALHTSGRRGSSSSKQSGGGGSGGGNSGGAPLQSSNHKHLHFPQPSPRGGSAGSGGGLAGNPPGLLSGAGGAGGGGSFFSNVTPTFRDRVSGTTSRDPNSHADPLSHSSFPTPSSTSSHLSQHQVSSHTHAHAHSSSGSLSSSTIHALNAQNRPKPSRSPPGLVQKPVAADKNSSSSSSSKNGGTKKGRSSASGKHASPPNGTYGALSQKGQKRPSVDLMSTLVLAQRTAVDIEKVLARCDFGADFDSVLSDDLKLMSLSSAQMTRGMPPARVASSYTASRFAFATCDELTDARAPASLSVGIGGGSGGAPSSLAVPTRPLSSASSSLSTSGSGIGGVAQRQRTGGGSASTQSQRTANPNPPTSTSSLLSSALSSIARSSDLSPSAMPFLSNSSSIGAMTDDIRGQVQSFLGPPHSSSQQHTTSSLSTAASPFTSTAAATGLSLLNTTGSGAGGNGRPAPASPMHAHGGSGAGGNGQAPHGGAQPQQQHRPRGEAAFFEPEPDASLYGSLPVAAALGGRLAQGSHAAGAGAGGRFGAGGDPYAADESRGSSYHLFNNPSPRHAQRSRGQRGGDAHHGSLGGGGAGPSLSMCMTSLTRAQSAGTENKSSSSSLLGDRFDSYSSAFGAHDAFSGSGSPNAAGSSNADYSGAVSGANLSLNFPPGLGGGQNGGPGSGSQSSLLGRAGTGSAGARGGGGQRGAATGGGFGDDILGGSSSAWRMQPHEQKMSQQQQRGGPSGGSVGGHRGAARGTIGGPAPPRQPHMDRNGVYGNPPPSGQRGTNSSGSTGMGDFGGQGGGGFPSLYPTSKRPRSRYDFYGGQHGGS